MTYTYEVQQNIGTTGYSMFQTKYIAFVKNEQGHIVKTVYGHRAVIADRLARKACEKFERKGGTLSDRMEASNEEHRARRRAAKAAKAERKAMGGEQ